jgi:hypothetical protein
MLIHNFVNKDHVTTLPAPKEYDSVNVQKGSLTDPGLILIYFTSRLNLVRAKYFIQAGSAAYIIISPASLTNGPTFWIWQINSPRE